MLEEAIPSFLTSFHAWLTPTVLFVLLNVVIGTIAITSKTSRHESDTTPTPADAAAKDSISAKLFRSPCSILHHFRSFILHLRRPVDAHHDPISPLLPSSPTDRIEPDPDSKDPAPCESDCLNRSHSDASSAVSENDTKIQAWMKKSASEKSVFQLLEKAENLQHPDIAGGDEGWEVDARADDFINRFRQQLELQRRDSLNRYKATLSRGE